MFERFKLFSKISNLLPHETLNELQCLARLPETKLPKQLNKSTLRTYVDLSKPNVAKCNSQSVIALKELIDDSAVNLQSYLKHCLDLQLNLCRVNAGEALRAIIDKLGKQVATDLETWRTYMIQPSDCSEFKQATYDSEMATLIGGSIRFLEEKVGNLLVLQYALSKKNLEDAFTKKIAKNCEKVAKFGYLADSGYNHYTDAKLNQWIDIAKRCELQLKRSKELFMLLSKTLTLRKMRSTN